MAKVKEKPKKKNTAAKLKVRIPKNPRKQKLDDENLIFAEMCLDCENECKVKHIIGAVMTYCPDFKRKK